MKLIKNLEYTYYFCNRMYYRGRVQRFAASKLMSMANIFHSSDISVEASIGANIRFGHGGIGIVIHANTKIGDNCYVMQGVTVGGKNGGFPIIGDNVTICTNSVVLGHVEIGANSVVGALSLVTHDVASDVVVAGIPAQEIRRNRKGCI